MTLTLIRPLDSDVSAIMEQRDTLINDTERAVVDAAFDAIFEAGKMYGVNISGDDYAARVEAEIIRLIVINR